MNRITLGWKLEDVSLTSIEGYLKRCKTKGLQADTTKLWWFEVRVIDISSSMQQRPSTDIREMEEKVESKADLEPLYFTVANDKRHMVLKDLKENSKYEISVRTCIDWLTSKDVNKKIKKESSFTSPLHEKTYKTFEDMLGLLTRPRRPLFPQVINFEATKVQLKWWPAKFSKNDSEDITYRIREYNHHQGVVVATVKDTTKWTFDGLKPQYEYFVTISAVNQQEEETKESWPLVFKTCKERTSKEHTFDQAELTPASPIDVRLFRFSEDKKHSQWVCWGSPYEGVGKIGYEMQFSSNYKDENTKFVESIANPLVPSSQSYLFFVHTQSEFEGIEYTSSASDTLEVISENIVRTESPFMYHIVLLTSKELKNGEYYMQPIIDEAPNLFEKIASGANVYWCVWDSNPFKSQSNKWIMKIKTFENVKRNNYQMTWISDEQWRIDPNVQVLIVDISEKKLLGRHQDAYGDYLLAILEYLSSRINEPIPVVIALEVLNQYFQHCENKGVDKKKLIKKFVDTIKTDLSTLINGTEAPPWEGVLSIIFIFDFVECINKTKLLQPQ
ncbi:hypothetical protein RFI_38590 [Reticulomyxa filosa]|uniref:Fibronectin type-III domain-containing protein n=1 Tax=Reticulomyxa filosa TaxID=46433 RepID=X6LA66_RETFI|nr:hypothetical protein RFI_38590 [Reticulomyxa filosa]|eukprot:ETN98897.1 hypothetical protein RFI_38590 [Reticulomyxa filosa]